MLRRALLQLATRRPAVNRCGSWTVLPTRAHWQGTIQKRFDRETGTWRYQDWDEVMLSSAEPMKGNRPLLDRYLAQKKHIPPSEQKRRLQDKRIYDRSVKRIRDLTKYIKFAREHRSDFGSSTGKTKF
jgi:hypothetical protein